MSEVLKNVKELDKRNRTLYFRSVQNGNTMEFTETKLREIAVRKHLDILQLIKVDPSTDKYLRERATEAAKECRKVLEALQVLIAAEQQGKLEL